jgi:hypothetical protein
MSMKITGRCHCGAVRYQAEVDIERVEICHCTDCQQLSGSAFRVIVPAIPGTFRLLEGTITEYVKTADSGNRRVQGFCPVCGSSVFGRPADSETGFFGLRVGTIDQRDRLVPRAQFWTRSAQGWITGIAGMTSHERE